MKRLETKEDVLAHFRYDRDSGNLYNLYDRGRCKKGEDASVITMKDGKIVKLIRWGGLSYYTSRLVFLIENDYLPANIEFKDGNRINTHHSNLREVKGKRFSRLRSDNKSGFKYVSWNESSKTWVVNITRKGKHSYYGSYKKLSDAAKRATELSRIIFKEEQ